MFDNHLDLNYEDLAILKWGIGNNSDLLHQNSKDYLQGLGHNLPISDVVNCGLKISSLKSGTVHDAFARDVLNIRKRIQENI